MFTDKSESLGFNYTVKLIDLKVVIFRGWYI